MNEDTLRRLEAEVKQLQELLRGHGMDGGVVNALLSLATVVHGTKENPGGLIKRMEDQDAKVEKLMKVFYMGAGAAAVINIAWMVFTHFNK